MSEPAVPGPAASGPAASGPAATPLEPDPDDGVAAVTVGLLLWAAAALACLLLRGELEARGAQWWLWTCGAGLAVGAGLLAFTRRRARVYRAYRARLRAEGRDAPGGTATE